MNSSFLQSGPFSSKAGIHRGPGYQGIDVYSCEIIKTNFTFDQDLVF